MRGQSLLARNVQFLSKEEEHALAVASRDGDLSARNKLVLAYAPFSQKLVKRYLAFGVPQEDLEQEAYLGLLRASQTFDPERGVKFATYAALWVKSCVREMILHSSGAVRRPVTDPKRELTRILSNRGKIDPSLNVSTREGGIEKIDLLPDPLRNNPEDEIAERSHLAWRWRTVADLFEMLTDRERQIIKARYLPGDGEPATLRDVGRDMNLSYERVRQIEEAVLAKLAAAAA